MSSWNPIVKVMFRYLKEFSAGAFLGQILAAKVAHWDTECIGRRETGEMGITGAALLRSKQSTIMTVDKNDTSAIVCLPYQVFGYGFFVKREFAVKYIGFFSVIFQMIVGKSMELIIFLCIAMPPGNLNF